ncbi:lytic transglycosylase domain-containing protein [Xaviernesmea oryzae]|nr:lytic transglycosylase domain-containing protein [Xaviernesmea oryzae]
MRSFFREKWTVFCVLSAASTMLLAAPAIAAAPATCVDGSASADIVQDLIRKEAQRQGIDVRLALAVAEQESGYGRTVNSPAGARGPMQLMPATALRYGVSDICDAAENVRGGVSYLKDLAGLFGGNVFLIVAAYNAGEERVFRAGGVPPIPETVNYVALVANAYYGFGKTLKRTRGETVGSMTEPLSAQRGQAVDLLMTSSPAPKPLPSKAFSPPRAQTGWIGGSVLYVQ